MFIELFPHAQISESRLDSTSLYSVSPCDVLMKEHTYGKNTVKNNLVQNLKSAQHSNKPF